MMCERSGLKECVEFREHIWTARRSGSGAIGGGEVHWMGLTMSSLEMMGSGAS